MTHSSLLLNVLGNLVQNLSPKAIVDKITSNVNTGREIEEIGEVKKFLIVGLNTNKLASLASQANHGFLFTQRPKAQGETQIITLLIVGGHVCVVTERCADKRLGRRRQHS